MTLPDTPLSRSELARRLGVHRATLIAHEKRGLLPAPRRVSHKRSEYRPADALRIAAMIGVAAHA